MTLQSFTIESINCCDQEMENFSDNYFLQISKMRNLLYLDLSVI